MLCPAPQLVANFATECASKRIFKIGQYLLKMWTRVWCLFLDPEGGSQKAILVVLVVVISSLTMPKAFLIGSGAHETLHVHSG